MNRLTYRPKEPYISKSSGDLIEAYSDADIRKIINRLAAYEDAGLTPEEIDDLASEREISPEAEYTINKHADSIIVRLDKLLKQTNDDSYLRKLARADKEGRVVVLPCKVGDTVYVSYGEGYRPCTVDRIHVLTNNEVQIRARYLVTEILLISASEFGKTVFLTREEAEEALEAMKNV